MPALPFVKGRHFAGSLAKEVSDARTRLRHRAAGSSAVRIDIDRLDRYQAALDFHTVTLSLRPASAELRDQLDRASLSIVLNIAEATGRVSTPDRARFFAIARGSALECAAVFGVLRLRSAVSDEAHARGRSLLVRLVQMLSRMASPRRRPA